MERTTIFISTETKMALKAAAVRTGLSQAELIRQAVTVFLAQNGKPRPRVFGSVKDGSFSAANYEDWLEENWHVE